MTSLVQYCQEHRRLPLEGGLHLQSSSAFIPSVICMSRAACFTEIAPLLLAFCTVPVAPTPPTKLNFVFTGLL